MKERPVRIGGALGIHYAYGDYSHDGSFARRNEDLGDVDLDIFRLNADIDSGNLIGRIEYRWYDAYSMMHTAWLGYESERYGTFKAGIVRVPFGPGPYGVSTSWFFDQHYYVGLSDDMDLGVRWSKSFGDLSVDLAYYVEDEGEWDGSSRDSTRYSYDLVTWDEQVDEMGNVTFGVGRERVRGGRAVEPAPDLRYGELRDTGGFFSVRLAEGQERGGQRCGSFCNLGACRACVWGFQAAVAVVVLRVRHHRRHPVGDRRPDTDGGVQLCVAGGIRGVGACGIA